MQNDFYTQNVLGEHPAVKNIGKYTYGNPKIMYWGENATLTIGKFCSIADNVKIFLGGNHKIDWFTTYPFSALNEQWPSATSIIGHPSTNGDVIIGNDVWIGHSSTILSGVKIGDGAVIGAESLVTKDIEPYTVVGGNPAKVIKKRFTEKEVKFLLELKWWEWEASKISDNIHILCSNDFYKLNKLIKKNFFKRILGL